MIWVVSGPAATVELSAAPGQVTIVGSATGLVRLTGQLHWTGHAPIAATRLNRVAGVLRLSYRRAAASPCTGNYRLVVPWRTAVVLRQPAGHVVISGLAGPLRITAHSVDIEIIRSFHSDAELEVLVCQNAAAASNAYESAAVTDALSNLPHGCEA